MSAVVVMAKFHRKMWYSIFPLELSKSCCCQGSTQIFQNRVLQWCLIKTFFGFPQTFVTVKPLKTGSPWWRHVMTTRFALLTLCEGIQSPRITVDTRDITRAVRTCRPWWRHQMETFSALLAFCAGNSPVIGEFPAQRPVTSKREYVHNSWYVLNKINLNNDLVHAGFEQTG